MFNTLEAMMAKLTIYRFSCIDSAELSVTPVTIIIGPQGSGKSITTKMLYFLADIPRSFISYIEKRETFEGFKKSIEKQFSLWFPPSAWGCHRFNITYSNGPFNIRVLRRNQKGKVGDDVVVSFSEWFERQYRQASSLFESHMPDDDFAQSDFDQVGGSIELANKLRAAISKEMNSDLEGIHIRSQTFIPAGRAFFTSIGRLVAGFEQVGSLDPVTIKFARLFANIRDRQSFQFLRRERRDSEYNSKRSSYMQRFFGGELRYEHDSEFVKADDGRRIPFSSLSSGQQEILPMWTLIDYYNEIDNRRTSIARKQSIEQLYIEEPEAHLFPSAQSDLMEFLVSSISESIVNRHIVITTHSPYIMSKINVFLKAGQLARRKKKNTEINDVVPRSCWLNEDKVSAYAIEDGVLKDILDDGMIDATYLDEISERISREFSQLLRIESEM